MVTFCLRPPEHKGPHFELASPLSMLHDHPYGKFQHTDKAWKQAMAKGWSSTSLPLTPQDLVCKRNGFVRNLENKKSAVVEMENMTHDIRVDWPYSAYSHRQERSAKCLAKLKIKDTCNTEKDVTRTLAKTKKKVIVSRVQKMKPARKPPTHSSKSPKAVIATVLPTVVPVPHLVPCGVSSSLKKLLPNVPPSIIAQARKCTVGITPTNPFISSPHGRHFIFPSASPSQEHSGHNSSHTHQVKPFSIPVKRIPLSSFPTSSAHV